MVSLSSTSGREKALAGQVGLGCPFLQQSTRRRKPWGGRGSSHSHTVTLSTPQDPFGA